MPSTFVFLSHGLSPVQIEELHQLHGGETVLVHLPQVLQERFSQVPPGPEFPADLLSDLVDWLASNVRPGDHALIQGDWGLTVGLVDACRKMGVRSWHATTIRQAKEVLGPDGSVVLEHVFSHRGFREYPPGPQ